MDPVVYFKENDFTESSVWQIAYAAELDQLEFVVSYAGFVPAIAPPKDDPAFEQPFDFRRLMFDNVTQLRRTDYRYKVGFQGFDPANFNYPAGHPFPTGHLEIEAAFVGKVVDARRTIVRYRAGIQLGSSGIYRFEFGTLAVSQRLVKIVPLRRGEVGHFDYHTNAKVAIDDPFADS